MTERNFKTERLRMRMAELRERHEDDHDFKAEVAGRRGRSQIEAALRKRGHRDQARLPCL